MTDVQIESMVTITGAEYVRLMAEIERMRARQKDITLEGLSLIGRIEAIREALAGADAGSLPNDYPVQKMAQDRMAELASLRATNERLRIELPMGGGCYACEPLGESNEKQAAEIERLREEARTDRGFYGGSLIRLEMENAKLRAALEEITKVERYYGYEADEMLNIARAALGGNT